MIFISLPAYAMCEEAGCKSQMPVKLFLLNEGGMGFLPPAESGKEWQFGFPTNNPAGPLMCRCPLHKHEERRVLAVAPNIQLIDRERH